MPEKRDQGRPDGRVGAAIRLAARRQAPAKARPAGGWRIRGRRVGWSLAFAAAVLLLGTTYWLLRSEIPESFVSHSAGVSSESSTLLTARTLYFPDAHGALRPEVCYLAPTGEIEADVREAIDHLVDAGRTAETNVRPWPDQVSVLDVFLSEEGLIYLNLASSLRWRMPAGDLAEWLIVASLTRSLCSGFAGIRGVRVMIDGQSDGPLRRVMPLDRTYRPEHFDDEVVVAS